MMRAVKLSLDIYMIGVLGYVLVTVVELPFYPRPIGDQAKYVIRNVDMDAMLWPLRLGQAIGQQLSG